MPDGILNKLKALLPGVARRADIDALIERIGSKHTPEDRRRAYALFLNSPLHAPVVSTGEAVRAKRKVAKKSKKRTGKKKSKRKAAKKEVASGNEQSLQLAMAEVNDFQMLLVYTGEDDPRISSHGEHCLSLPGRQAFEMALQTPGMDGLLIHNRRNAWMALPKVLLEEILEVFPPDRHPS